MNKSFKYIFASALLVASFMSDAFAQRKVTAEQSEAEKAEKSVMLTKKTTPVEGVDGAYYLDLETFITGYTSNVTTYETVEKHTPLDIVLLLDLSLSMNYNMAGNSTSVEADKRINILKNAVKNFIESIDTDAKENSVEHRISLIQFSGDQYPDGTQTQKTYYPRASEQFTYNSYGNSGYYYKDGDNYYQVSRGSNGSGNNKTYYLSYKANNQTYYLSGENVVTTRPTNVKNTTTTIWKGVLYSETIVPTSIVEGRVNGRSQVVKNFTLVGTETGASVLKTATESLVVSGYTYVNYGANLARLVFEQGNREGAVKVLILFTDGVPGASPLTLDKNVANQTIGISKQMKDSGVLVYTIGTFDNPSNDVSAYMNNTSSNYPNATSLTDSGARILGKDYFHNVTSAEALNGVFQTISDETSQEAANANAGYTEATTTNNVTIKDIVTENFVIPSKADGEINLGNIQVWTAKSTGVTRADNFNYQDYQYSEYTWADPVLREDLTPAAERGDDKKTTVSVPGFDYSENWVGWEDAYEVHEGGTATRKDSECTLHEGYKLILRILVEPDPDAVGGLVPTNDPASGLYITKDGTEISLKSYEVPPSVLVPMDLTIVMNGITDRGNKNLYKEGETAIFQVEGFGGKGWTVAVTADANGHGEASIKVPFYNNAEKDQFTVKEIKAWSYRFNSVVDLEKETGATEATATRTKQLTADDHIFYFKATDTEDLGSDGMVSRDFQVYFYDENNKNNVFNRATEN